MPSSHNQLEPEDMPTFTPGRTPRSYRIMTAAEKHAHVERLLSRHAEALSLALSCGVFLGLAMTSSGELSTTLVQEGTKARLYADPFISAQEFAQQIEETLDTMARGGAQRR